MTTYQDNPYYYVDSPLNQPDDDAPWWVAAEHYPPAVDPMTTIQRRMMIILAMAVGFILMFGLLVIRNGNIGATTSAGEQDQADNTAVTGDTTTTSDTTAEVAAAPAVPTGIIAPFFTREVQHWAPNIVAWATEYGLDPNMVATVMQIESCGDPNAVSSAGAQGLFQVMPFHFSPGEVMQDPDTNARRGMAYLALGMETTGGDTSRTFAGYNGGHGTAARSWDTWPAETQRYYVWSTGIYEDATTGNATSETLDQWLNAGGASLCRQAAARLGL